MSSDQAKDDEHKGKPPSTQGTVREDDDEEERLEQMAACSDFVQNVFHNSKRYFLDEEESPDDVIDFLEGIIDQYQTLLVPEFLEEEFIKYFEERETEFDVATFEEFLYYKTRGPALAAPKPKPTLRGRVVAQRFRKKNYQGQSFES